MILHGCISASDCLTLITDCIYGLDRSLVDGWSSSRKFFFSLSVKRLPIISASALLYLIQSFSIFHECMMAVCRNYSTTEGHRHSRLQVARRCQWTT